VGGGFEEKTLPITRRGRGGHVVGTGKESYFERPTGLKNLRRGIK